MRIATWNLQLPSPRTKSKNRRRLDKIHEIKADIWILTETHKDIDLSATHGGHPTDSSPRKPRSGTACATIWCRDDWPVLRTIPTSDPTEAVCIEVSHPDGPLLIYGSIIAYHGYKGPNGDLPSWEEHYRFIKWHQADWLRLREEFPAHSLITGGDYNQTRDGAGRYGTPRGRDLLSTALASAALTCVTEENFVATGKLKARHNVDHICIDHRLAGSVANVGAWERESTDGSSLSDHNGVWADLVSMSTSQLPAPRQNI